MTTSGPRPRLANKARVRFDRKSGKHLLLWPERGLVLNAAATAIVRLCTGEHSVDEIVARLVAAHAGSDRERVGDDVRRFLASMAERGLVRDAS